MSCKAPVATKKAHSSCILHNYTVQYPCKSKLKSKLKESYNIDGGISVLDFFTGIRFHSLTTTSIASEPRMASLQDEIHVAKAVPSNF